MGLDWLPRQKPKPGHEAEFYEALKEWSEALEGYRDHLKERIDAVSIMPYETIGAPRVGRDPEAISWLREQLKERDPSLTEQDLDREVREWDGFYVVPLAPPCDGIAQYSNGQPGGYVEQTSFRGKMLDGCKDVIGKSMLKSAYEEKEPEELRAYGNELIVQAEAYAARHGVDLARLDETMEEMRKQESLGKRDEFAPLSRKFVKSKEFKLDVVLAAGRWCIYWGERGHALEPYF